MRGVSRLNPYNKAHELAQALVNSDEYLQLIDAKRRLDTEPPARQMVDDFHRRQFELMRAEASGQAPSQAQIEQMQKLYEIISMNPYARDYLNAEMRFSRLMADIQEILTKALEELNAGGEAK